MMFLIADAHPDTTHIKQIFLIGDDFLERPDSYISEQATISNSNQTNQAVYLNVVRILRSRTEGFQAFHPHLASPVGIVKVDRIGLPTHLAHNLSQF
jgi:hypothetical protein